jgi:hypothetical protein
MGACTDEPQHNTPHPTAAGTRRPTAREDPLAIRYAAGTWKKDTHVYKNPPLPFTGPEPGCTHPYGRLPSLIGLLEKFWSPKLQCRIVRETNRYASEVVDDKTGQTRGGLEWTPLVLEEF